MSQMIESMEPRTLFAATPTQIAQDLAGLNTLQLQAKTDLTAGLNEVGADFKAIKAAAGKPTSAQKALLTTLQKDERAGVAKYKKTILGILTAGKKNGTRLVAALKKLQAKPTDATLQANAQAALTALQGVFSNQAILTVETNAGATVSGLNTDLDAVGTAIPNASMATGAAKLHLEADLTKLASEATGIQAGLSTLATHLA